MKGEPAQFSIGERFSRLVVVAVTPGLRNSVTARCDCGATWKGNITTLRSGATKSCGCFNLDAISGRNTTHGMSKTPEYRAWKALKKRCYNMNGPDYPLYGARGIRVCNRWLEDFVNFFMDMGERPSSKHSVDRIDSNGNYEPGNCRWATALQQARNTSRNVRYEYQGRSLTIKEWCDELNLPLGSIKSRLADGWEVESAFETPVKASRAGEKLSQGALTMTLSEWGKYLGVGLTTLSYRVNHGWPLEHALSSQKYK